MKRSFIGLLLVGFCFFISHCNGAKTVKLSCGGSSSAKNIALNSPANPPRDCIYHVKAYSKKVCQLRIDFAMTLAQPSLPGPDNDVPYVKCIADVFQVGNVQLCGTETKQHIYVPLNRTGGETNIDILLSVAARIGGAQGLPKPTWDMTVTQLECPTTRLLELAAAEEEDFTPTGRATSDAFLIAPPGCLQYFPEDSGIITSFNYDQNKGIYPGMLNYAICFRRQTKTRGLQLKAVVFDLGGERSSSVEAQLDSNCYSTQGDIDEDYLLIPQGSIVGKNMLATYFCGHSIDGRTVLSTNPGPLYITFNSNGKVHPHETGFYISYKLDNVSF